MIKIFQKVLNSSTSLTNKQNIFYLITFVHMKSKIQRLTGKTIKDNSINRISIKRCCKLSCFSEQAKLEIIPLQMILSSLEVNPLPQIKLNLKLRLATKDGTPEMRCGMVLL